MRSNTMISFSIAAMIAGCGAAVRPFAAAPPLVEDPDREPFAPKPAAYESPFAWDAVDQTLFRPLTRLFAVDPGGEAMNVNALDEAPASSWFEPRITRGMTPAEVAQGPCTTPPLDPRGPFTVTGGKPNGANPGFFIEGPDGRSYLLKFDGDLQPERATAADVVGSLIYHAAGFHVPCNRVVFFEPDVLVIGEDATAEESGGDEVPMTQQMIDDALTRATRLPDGRYRGSSSLLLEGDVLGPFTYQGVRSDDPNDVVPHEDRRDLRGSYVLASWVNHFDSREQNSLSMWIEVGEKGYVKHHLIDFGDSLGSEWPTDRLTRRLGHSNYLDVEDVVIDLFTAGAVERPWDVARPGKFPRVFGYFDSEPFAPDAWDPGYPNPAFSRMTERDAAWMARIVAHFTDADVEAIVAQARLSTPELQAELTRILLARRDRLLERWLSRLSPLWRPTLVEDTAGIVLCLEDLAVRAGLVAAEGRTIEARAARLEGDTLHPLAVRALPTGTPPSGPGLACVALARPEGEAYLIVDVVARGFGEPWPARVHLALGGAQPLVVGLERFREREPLDASD